MGDGSRPRLGSSPFDPSAVQVATLLQHNLVTSLRPPEAVSTRMMQQAETAAEDAPAGSIVNLSSIAANRTQPELLAYSVSSAALNQMTRSMEVAFAPHRIPVDALAVGPGMLARLKHTQKDH